METTKVSPHSNRRGSRRRLPRASVKVECRRGYCGLGPNVLVNFLDLSEGGLRFVAKSALEPKGEVEVLISNFGLRQPIKRLANVAWVLPLEDGQFCVGLQFQKRLSYQDLQQFARP
jgi:hypothetical protein